MNQDHHHHRNLISRSVSDSAAVQVPQINPSTTLDSHDAHTHIIVNQNSDTVANSTDNHSNIHDLARITNWPRVQALASTQPSHASYKCDHGLTALHHACSRRCPHPAVFAALINAYPNALIEKDYDKGWTPLHHACRFKCPAKCVELLLNSYPDFGRYACQVRDQRNGRTPLYYAIRYDAPDGVVEMLLNFMERSDILGCDRDGMSVLGLVWDRWAMSFEGKRIVRYYSKILKQWKDQRKDLGFSAENQLENEEFRSAEEKWWKGVLSDSKTLRNGVKGKLALNWDKAKLLLLGAFKFDLNTKDDVGVDGGGDEMEEINDEKKGEGNDYNPTDKLPATTRRRKFRILHATAAIGCHESLFTMACALYPHQAREIDRGDLFGGEEKIQQIIPFPERKGSLQTPRRKNMATKQGGEEEKRESEDGEDHERPQDCLTALHICAKSPNTGPEARHALQHLILFNPRAASYPNPADKSLPLHYICENESKVHWIHDGIRLLYQTYPAAATVLDWKGRTPLHRAATLQESAPTQMMFVTSESQNFMDLNVTGHIGLYGTLRISLNSTSTGTASASGRTLTSGEASIPSTATLSSSRFSIASCEDQAGSIIQNILFLHPEVASIRDFSGKTPFHSIAEYAEVWDRNVQAIYDAHTGALATRDNTPLKSLPMHLVAANTYAKPSFVRRILECHPRASSMANGVGMLPLHLACGAGKRWEEEEDHEQSQQEHQQQEQQQDDEDDEGDENDAGAAVEEESHGGGLKDIYEAFPGAISIVDDGGKWTPLHCAVATSHGTTRQMVEKLLELGPCAAHAVDAMGRTPFHLAVESGRGWDDGLDLLFEANPDAIDAPDAEGKIPIVAALLRYCKSDTKEKNHNANHSECDANNNLGRNSAGLEMLEPSSMDSAESIESSPSRAHLLPLEEEPLIEEVSDVEIATRPSNANEDTDTAVAITAHPMGSVDAAPDCDDSAEVQQISQVNVLFHLLRIAPQVLRPQDGTR